MNLRDLEYLVALAEHGHFGRAAEACWVSQPTLSTQIRKLEDELGVPLVERTARGALLTDVGREVVARAREVLAGAADIVRLAEHARDPGAGTVRVAVIPTVAPYLLPHVVPGIHRRWPRLRLLLEEARTDDALDRLRSGAVDAAVVALPVDDRGLRTVGLFTEDFVLAAPADHPLAGVSEPVPTDVLADHEVLLLEEGHCFRDQALEVCRRAGASEHRDLRATSLETLRQMVAAGVGVTLLPELAVRPPAVVPPGVVVRRFAEPAPRRELAVCWRSTTPRQPLLEELAGALAEVPDDLTGPPARQGVDGSPAGRS